MKVLAKKQAHGRIEFVFEFHFRALFRFRVQFVEDETFTVAEKICQ